MHGIRRNRVPQLRSLDNAWPTNTPELRAQVWENCLSRYINHGARMILNAPTEQKIASGISHASSTNLDSCIFGKTLTASGMSTPNIDAAASAMEKGPLKVTLNQSK
jgi:hypothetical protein